WFTCEVQLSPAVLVLTFMRHVGGGLLDLTNEIADAEIQYHSLTLPSRGQIR
ncbi:hypothetical protein ATANTOWER_018747, partial [Ataeniobius toweri]|nr:hypothetical protein [Ataeniobius toweri]